MDNISPFSDTCSYCYRNINDGIINCCQLTICEEHIYIHNGHVPLYYAKRHNNTLILNSSILTEEEINSLRNYINSGEYKNIADNLTYADCKHKKALQEKLKPKVTTKELKEENTPIKCPKKAEIICDNNNCGLTCNIHICLECGYQGCGRVQYGIEGNGHASDHYKDSSHGLNVNIDSLTVDNNNRTYCYDCNDFVKNKDIREDLRLVGRDMNDFLRLKSEMSINKEPRAEDDMENKKNTNVSPDLLGIVNAGNTCYISSILQLLSSNKIKLDDHFSFCDVPATSCFMCQFIKVITALSDKQTKEHYMEQISSINIATFLSCCENALPLLNISIQQDAAEFLSDLITLIKTYEEAQLIPNIMDQYAITLEEHSECDQCDISNSYTTSDAYSLILFFRKSVKESLELYYTRDNKKCSCGGILKTTCEFVRVPQFLILVVNRCNLPGDHHNGKIKDEIHVNECLVLKGGTVYKKKMAVLHKGESFLTGHFVVEFDGIIINDDVFVKKTEFGGQDYIILYERVE